MKPASGIVFGLLVLLVGVGDARATPVFTGNASPCVAAGLPVQLHVTVEHVRNDDGLVTITVYGDDPDDFLAPGRKLGRVRVAARSEITVACLAVPERESYAITVYHDENGDRDFNRNIVGYPLEGYGVSNGGTSLFGIPSYDSARFAASSGANHVSITLQY